MIFPEKYNCLEKNLFSLGPNRIIPIRYKDQFSIMTWRNEQKDILRQDGFLTIEEQRKYFSTTIRYLFDEVTPIQLLFSFFENEVLIGYGGLVHIDWRNQNAEISFLLKTELNVSKYYIEKFTIFLKLMEALAKLLCFHKIYTYGYNTEEYRFTPLINLLYDKEAVLKKHKKINEKFYDVLIYSKFI